jgi:hypothetical protein
MSSGFRFRQEPQWQSVEAVSPTSRASIQSMHRYALIARFEFRARTSLPTWDNSRQPEAQRVVYCSIFIGPACRGASESQAGGTTT